VIDYARNNVARVTSTQSDNATCLEFFNDAVKECEDDIASYLMEWYYDNDNVANLVAGTSIYPIPVGTAATASIPQLKNLVAVEILYAQDQNANYQWVYNALTAYVENDIVERSSDDVRFRAVQASTWQSLSDTDYWVITDKPTPVRAKRRMISTMDRGESRYTTNQAAEDPFFIITGNNVKIYPTPTRNVVNWLKFFYARSDLEIQIANISDTATYNALTIPRQYHKRVIAKYIAYRIFESRWRVAEADRQEVKYEQSKQNMVETMLQRYSSPEETVNPFIWNTNLMY
jgi:hypothetical protein